MKFGIDLPNLGYCGDARVLAEFAREAEDAGWDGVFVWDSVMSPAWDEHLGKTGPSLRAVCDPWIALAAIATATQRVRIGPMVTPVTRRRPWKLARETVTLDHLSGGRLILPVALGSVDDAAFANVNEETDRKVRAERLDEGLAVLAGLWSGEPFSFAGKHFRVDDVTFLPRPVQQPRIPVWVVGAWPRPKSMRRTLRWDGIIPTMMTEQGAAGIVTPDEIRALSDYVRARRADDAAFDIVFEGRSSGSDPAKAREKVQPFADAGITWWIESVWEWQYNPERALEGMHRRIRSGPPPVQ